MLKPRNLLTVIMLVLTTVLSACAPFSPTQTTSQPVTTTFDIAGQENIPGVPSGTINFSIVALPDTQYYSETYPQIFLSQTQWIADNVKKDNIIFVTHSGDIVNDYNEEKQWQFAEIALNKLDGVVPYGVLPGNHDQPTDLYNRYFGINRFNTMEWYGGHYGDTNDNNYQLITIQQYQFLFLQLQFSPTPEIIRWAEGIIGNYPNRTVILNTHSALDTSANLTSEGKTILPLVENNDNLRLVLCGHIHGEAVKQLYYGATTKYVLLADYQNLEKGGDGYLRILTFVPAQNNLVVNTYSPFLNSYLTDTDSHFVLDFKLSPNPVSAKILAGVR